MIIIKPSFDIINEPNWPEAIQHIERCGRTCYKSETKITEESAIPFVKNIIKRGHESVLEHISFSVRFIATRGFTHEMVRHRIASFSQESTRYVSYGGQEMQFILPRWVDEIWANSGSWNITRYNKEVGGGVGSANSAEYIWLCGCIHSELVYNELIQKGWKPQQARTVLNNSVKTEIVVTANIREWRKILSLRCDATAHPEMRELMVPLHNKLISACPCLFESVDYTPSNEDLVESVKYTIPSDEESRKAMQ